MSWKAALSLGIPALVVVTGYVVTHRNNLRLSERKDRLERINRQLGELYGPLFATASASNAAWLTFRSQYRPTGAYWGGTGPKPTPEEAAAWRLWITTVFMPLNRQMATRSSLVPTSLMRRACPTCSWTCAPTFPRTKPC
jgi:hypothetical protein